MTTLEQRLIDVDGGILEVFLSGTGEPTICTSHPFNASSPDKLAFRSGMGRLVAVTPRGLGRSSAGRGPGDYIFRQQVTDLEAVRRRLGIERWVFWGSSAGGCLGLLYALAYPEALSGLIVEYIGPSGQQLAEDARSVISPHHPQYQRELALLAARGPLERRPAVLESLEPRLAAAEWVKVREDAPQPWVLLRDGGPLWFGRGGDQNWAANEEFAVGYDVRDRLGEIRLPTLVVAGRRDEFIPLAYAELLHAGIAQSQFVVLDETGHGDIAPGSADDMTYNAALRTFLDHLPN
jgi:proline iminopeptidase